MRSARLACAAALLALTCAAAPQAAPLATVHQRRFAMGTMFEIVVHHHSRAEAAQAVAAALDEVVRLDRVMSDYDPASDLAALVREARHHEAVVDPSLFEVIRTSLAYSARSSGRFDVTIAPLLDVWRRAADAGRSPDAAEIARARECVGYQKVRLLPPNRIRFASDCVAIDLGAIGKGFAVDRAISILTAAGIANAIVDAGRSSIAAIGAPPGREGWPVTVGVPDTGGKILTVRNASVSTAQQQLTRLSRDGGRFGAILDPRTGAPAAMTLSVTVVAPTATMSDALDTTLVLLPREESRALLEAFDGVSAFWVTAEGRVLDTYPVSR